MRQKHYLTAINFPKLSLMVGKGNKNYFILKKVSFERRKCKLIFFLKVHCKCGDQRLFETKNKNKFFFSFTFKFESNGAKTNLLFSKIDFLNKVFEHKMKMLPAQIICCQTLKCILVKFFYKLYIW